MTGESIPIPATRIEPVATEAASAAKSIAGVVLFLAVIVLLIGAGMISDDKGGTAAGMLFWAAIVGSIGWRHVKAARRATVAGRHAAADPASHWFLSGRFIIGMDGAGAPNPALTFRISRKQRKLLIAVPAATVVEHGKRAL
jgi:hypothetical protein